MTTIEHDNPNTAGLDGADRAEWHTPATDINGRIMATVTAAVVVLLAIAAGAWLLVNAPVPVTLSLWLLLAALLAALGVGCALGVGLMAAMALAGQTDARMEQAAHE